MPNAARLVARMDKGQGLVDRFLNLIPYARCAKSSEIQESILQRKVVESTTLNMFIYLETKCYIRTIILTMLEPIENWGVFPIFLID